MSKTANFYFVNVTSEKLTKKDIVKLCGTVAAPNAVKQNRKFKGKVYNYSLAFNGYRKNIAKLAQDILQGQRAKFEIKSMRLHRGYHVG